MKRRVKVLRMRRIGAGPEYGPGWATWHYYDGLHCITGVFALHPTHEAALAHALVAVGLDKPAEHREAP